MRIFGLALIIAALFLPLMWFAPLMAKHDALAVFSQFLGTFALVGMAIGQILAIRWTGLEPIFGGLDRIYVIHKWLGISALATMVLHDIIDADVQGLGRETLLNDIAETVGEVSLYGIIALILITIITFIPYHLWRWTHKLMGAFFIAGAFHFAFILKPFSNGDPLGLYTLAFCALGALAYFWTLLPFPFAHGRHAYTVTGVEKTGDAIAISLSAQSRGVAHKAGQFAFIRFEDGETHPFTISQAPKADRSLRFTVKPLGDDTRRFDRAIQMGQTAFISSAFGHFKARPKAPQIWVAGGIGITPFMAMAEEIGEEDVTLFYCMPTKSNAAHLAALEEIAFKKPNFTLHIKASQDGARFQMHELQECLGDYGKNTHVYSCGPDGLRNAVQASLSAWSHSARKFHYEAFEIRSGIGIRKFVGWIAPKFMAVVQKRSIG